MNSPYDAPAADLSTTIGNAATYQPVFFSLSGRIGRARYVAYMMGAIALMMVAVFGIALLMTLVGKVGGVVMTFLPLLMAVLIMAANFVFVIRRLHDMNRTGWLSLLALVPFVGIVFGLWVLFGPGDKEANQYGAAPGPNGTGVLAACCVAGVAMVIAAFVAFGAYKVASLGISGNSSRWTEHNPAR